MKYKDFIEDYYKISTYDECYAPQFQPVDQRVHVITTRWIGQNKVFNNDAHSVLKLIIIDGGVLCYGDEHLIIMTLNPRPIDLDVLYDQNIHRSETVWDDRNTPEINCRRHEAVVYRTIPLHRNILLLLCASDFYGIITALVERWRLETHTFHMSRHNDWLHVCQELLGVTPPPEQIRGSRLNLTWLRVEFPGLADDVDEETITRYARAYIFTVDGGSMFTDKSTRYVHLMFLPFLANLHYTRQYSWGGTCLA
ncbi:serine/threonine-protein phosphatase 7 long form-like protein [Cucumis melo var. makuwa]|uniref:Serine/threonine-protein phosphatase 7 long form-like protein n=1 Tax=Cucumis melo var. makuwa TaxID=1194695 RepID=A0A5A7TJS3_CUCMM|nr:serine/threonine-protein phosphatase 7 long form-like protein [Cucumis melo var. makuwa]TYK06307.1 serine/threonine-protein phosphatase 7 long form-like protein [Cucumis melo var. makuwa]